MSYHSIIRKNDKFKGVYVSSGTLLLDGFFEGDLKIDQLFVSETGTLSGTITAKQVFVYGNLIADIETEKLHIKSSGKIQGNLLYATITVEEGAIILSKNMVNMSNEISLKRKLKNNS